MPGREVALAGAGWSTISRRSDRSLGALAVDACSAALADAGLSWQDVDGLATYPSTAGSGGQLQGVDAVSVEYVAQTMGLSDVPWYLSLERGTIGAVLAATVDAVAAGRVDVAVVWKAMHTPKGAYGSFAIDRAPGESQFRAPYGMGGPYNAGGGAVSEFALPYSQYLARHSLDRLLMGEHVVRNRANAASNPHAVWFERPIAMNDWRDTAMVSDPLSLLDCDMAVDGAGAVVVMAGDRARDLGGRVAWVHGHVSSGIHYRRAPSLLWDDLVDNATWMSQRVLGSSGTDSGEIGAAAIYDGFSYFVPLWLEAAGFCPVGEAFGFIADGNTEPGARLTLNVLGGNLGMGRLHGMPQIVDGLRQAQGRAWDGQSEPAPRTLVTVGSATHGAAAFVLGSEPR